MNIKSFDQLTHTEKENFFAWLKEQENDDPAYENMWDDDWKNKPNTLPYILTNTSRYSGSNGSFHIVYDDLTIVACAAIYKASFNNLIALAGTRTWVAEEYRNSHVMGYILLPEHKKWAVDQGCKQIALCFNDYNKNLINLWKRKRLGEQRKAREKEMIFYSNFNEVTFPVIIKKIKQWVIYEKLDTGWEFNWKIISAQ